MFRQSVLLVPLPHTGQETNHRKVSSGVQGLAQDLRFWRIRILYRVRMRHQVYQACLFWTDRAKHTSEHCHSLRCRHLPLVFPADCSDKLLDTPWDCWCSKGICLDHRLRCPCLQVAKGLRLWLAGGAGGSSDPTHRKSCQTRGTSVQGWIKKINTEQKAIGWTWRDCLNKLCSSTLWELQSFDQHRRACLKRSTIAYTTKEFRELWGVEAHRDRDCLPEKPDHGMDALVSRQPWNLLNHWGWKKSRQECLRCLSLNGRSAKAQSSLQLQPHQPVLP